MPFGHLNTDDGNVKVGGSVGVLVVVRDML